MSSTNFTIPIGTSNPLDLCSGLPLFPGLGTARAGVSAAARTFHLFDTAVLIVCTRLKISAYAGYGFGICGPSIAFLSQNVNVNRANAGNQGQLTLTFNNGMRMQAGAFAGAYVTGGVTLTLQIYLPRPWFKFWALTWQNVFTTQKDFTVDILGLMFKLIQYLLSRSSQTSSFTKDPQNRLKNAQPSVSLQTFSLFDMAGSNSGVTPNLTATPKVTAPINLMNYDPVLKAINKGLAKIGGEISVGPTVNFEFPVRFNFSEFTTVGGLQGGAESANYGPAQYVNGRVSAIGNTPFNIQQNPSRVTTQVTSQTALKVLLSIHFKVKVAKFFNLERNTPSLDLTALLFRVRQSSFPQVPGQVSTNVSGNCVLTPSMTLSFRGPTPGVDAQTGERVEGTVTLPGFASAQAAIVNLTIDPPVAGFPSSVTIPARSESAAFDFTFQNQCVATGNPNDPTETAPAGPISSVQTYLVRGTLANPPNNACTDYRVEVPLNIANRFLRCQRAPFTPAGTAPQWDPLAGATIKADIDQPDAPTGGFLASLILWFPYPPPNQGPPATTPVTFTLLDENLQPYTRSGVEIIVGQQRVTLNPSGTLPVTLASSYGSITNRPNASIFWGSKGRHTGYSNRFYLIVDAGCQYGQTEFWLDVFNWS